MKPAGATPGGAHRNVRSALENAERFPRG